MGLRTKISAIFVPLLVLAVLAVSATEANHAVGVMVESLGDSGTVLVNQTFEQIRTALAHTQGDAATVLRNDTSLAALLSSSRAFGKGVVYARVVALNGDLIAGTSADAVSRGSAAAVRGTGGGGLAMVAVATNPSAMGRAHLRDQQPG